MNNRIKELRASLVLTQQEFADKLGTSRGNIAGYETGKRSPSDAVVSLICREFNVREEWLRDGSGEMFVKLSPFEKAYNRFGYIMENSTPSKKAALTMLLELLYAVPDETWELIMKQYDDALSEIKRED